MDLHNSRSAGFQANPIAYSEILAYYTLYQTTPDAWEVSAIRRLDGVVMQVYAEEADKANKRQAAKSSK